MERVDKVALVTNLSYSRDIFVLIAHRCSKSAQTFEVCNPYLPLPVLASKITIGLTKFHYASLGFVLKLFLE